MTNKELQKMLAEHPDSAEVWMTVWNGHTETYGLVDNVYDGVYDVWRNDFFGTPGRMDRRLFDNHRLSKDNQNDIVLCLTSRFGAIPDSEIDCGSDDINYPIKTINGPDGDADLVWHINSFEEITEPDGKRKFVKSFENGSVTYYPDADTLVIENKDYDISFSGQLTGIEDIRNILEACKVPFGLYV